MRPEKTFLIDKVSLMGGSPCGNLAEVTLPDPSDVAAPAARPVRGTAAAPTLQTLGLSVEAEALYRTLLRLPGLSGLTLAPHLAGWPPAEVEPALVSLQQRGLVRCEGGQAWFATAPEVAIELLLMERQVELNQARQVLPDLQRELMRGEGLAASDAVRLVAAEAEVQLSEYLQVHHAARREVAIVMCPPFVVSAPDAMEAAREQARRRGVRYRTLVGPELLQWPGWHEAVRQSRAAGDEVRVHAGLPFKMVLADRICGLIPLRSEAPEGPALRLGPTAALDALWALFESLWVQAAPALEPPAEGQQEAGDKSLHALVTLLASGANDKTIAGVLEISERTLLRRIHALSDQLQARSRFQCGWLAAGRFSRDF